MRRMLAVLATSAALALSTALPAGATTGAAPGPSGSGNECVADVDTKKVTCFDTFREAAKAGSDGAITDADNPKELNAALASYREDWAPAAPGSAPPPGTPSGRATPCTSGATTPAPPATARTTPGTSAAAAGTTSSAP